jgi:hypothetical protein
VEVPLDQRGEVERGILIPTDDQAALWAEPDAVLAWTSG